MGVPGLLPLLKEHLEQVDMSEIKGCRVGVDAYSWLYKAVSTYAVDVYLAPTGEEALSKCIGLCLRKCEALQKEGVQLYFVFDGEEHPMKSMTAQKRREKKEEAREKIEVLLRRGRKEEAYRLMSRSLKVDKVMAGRFMDALAERDIPYIRAPYEADPQLAYLEREGLVDYIMTEDSDLVVYGAKRILFKLNESMIAVLYDRERVLKVGGESVRCLLTHIKEIVALSGCDYTEGIRNVGLITAHRLMMVHKSARGCIEFLARKSIEVMNHWEVCQRVVCTFKMHVVIDPRSGERRYFEETEGEEFGTEEGLGDLSFVGSLVESSVSSQTSVESDGVELVEEVRTRVTVKLSSSS
ncbi:exonuclease 1 [Nematocida homosporus]|uniref:exonuclease 1 n=1 Tax=Nematocida homosporus TaxID=1912981 RepID=UPI00222064F1|nr:exonuclease 1 [Nematocida homosporus]KAI5185302.1 exonuclease 1 [Nematocida homosporus]